MTARKAGRGHQAGGRSRSRRRRTQHDHGEEPGGERAGDRRVRFLPGGGHGPVAAAVRRPRTAGPGRGWGRSTWSATTSRWSATTRTATAARSATSSTTGPTAGPAERSPLAPSRHRRGPGIGARRGAGLRRHLWGVRPELRARRGCRVGAQRRSRARPTWRALRWRSAAGAAVAAHGRGRWAPRVGVATVRDAPSSDARGRPHRGVRRRPAGSAAGSRADAPADRAAGGAADLSAARVRTAQQEHADGPGPSQRARHRGRGAAGAGPVRRGGARRRHGGRTAGHALRAAAGSGHQGGQGVGAQGRPGLRSGHHRDPHPRAHPGQVGGGGGGPQPAPRLRHPGRHLPRVPQVGRTAHGVAGQGHLRASRSTPTSPSCRTCSSPAPPARARAAASTASCRPSCCAARPSRCA